VTDTAGERQDARRRAVDIVEVGPRDGLQNESVLLGTDAKVAYIKALLATGLRRIEATSFVHPGRVPQMADAERVMEQVPRPHGVRYAGLVLNQRGLDRALATGLDEVNVVVVATETFSQRNQGMSVGETLRSLEAITRRAKSAGLFVTATIGATFGCPFEGEVSPDHVASLARRCADVGVDEIAVADTIGSGVPSDVERVLSAVRSQVELPLRCHFHNTRNTGYANALAAIDAGVSALDASSGGIGGCPFAPRATGNIATEDLTWQLSRSGIHTGVDLGGLLAAAQVVEEHLGKPNPGLLGRAGPFPEVVRSAATPPA
jgi:hydroxymethylglutaryl-CoA lyase